jgi:hypothetical protein
VTRELSKDALHLHLTRASLIKVRPVRYAWRGRIPLGSITLLGGREGIGKSVCLYSLFAEITRGSLDGDLLGTPRNVIIAATEDSWEHTIVPRLIAADADLNRVYRVDVATPDSTQIPLSLPRDLPALEREALDIQAAAIGLDPLLSRLDSKIDTHKDADVRRGLEPLAALADATNAAIVGLIHINKSNSQDVLSTLMASRAFAAVARAVLVVMVDPEDEQTRLLGLAKTNVGRLDVPTLRFTIDGIKVADTPEGEVWTGRLAWAGESVQTIREHFEAASESAGDRTATSEASDWLSDYLTSEGGTAESAAVKAAGKRAGHSIDALKRARKKLRIVSDSRGFPRRTYWILQPTTPTTLTAPTAPTALTRQSEQSAQFAETGS